jgi:hypothetical protein
MRGYIYKLICPIKEKPIYVGSTILELSECLKHHILNSGSNKGVQEYILGFKMYPLIELIETVQFIKKSKLFERERYWIKRLSKSNTLYNRNNNVIVKTSLVKVDAYIHSKVAKEVAGTGKTIGEFYDEAALEKLKPINKAI